VVGIAERPSLVDLLEDAFGLSDCVIDGALYSPGFSFGVDDLVTNYVKLWPREVFYVRDSQCVSKLKESLNHAGVHILYQDFDVFYGGQSDWLFKRLHGHPKKRYRLWNHFSAFVVPRKEHLDYVEAIMIAATPRTANRQGGRRIEKIDLPEKLEKKLTANREIR
jgi:hypothetical protein